MQLIFFVQGSQSDNQAVTLKTASRVFVSRDYTVNRDYKTLIEEQYQSGVIPMNFVSPEVTAANINDEIKTFTNGLITALLDPSKSVKQDFMLDNIFSTY